MQKILSFFSLLIVLNSCGQTTQTSTTKKDSTALFDAISNDICNCARTGDTTQQVLALFNSCWAQSINKHKQELSQLNINPQSSAGSSILYQEITQKRFSINCSEIFNLALKESQAEENSHKSFMGIIIAEKELENGQYETEVKSTSTKEIKKFVSNVSFKAMKFSTSDIKTPINIVYKVVPNSTGKQVNKVLSIDGYGDTEIHVEEKY